MDKKLKKYQDRMTDYVVKAKELQNETGLVVGLRIERITDFIPVDALIKSLLNQSIKPELKRKLLNVSNNEDI
jgi:hypothetical protein